RAVPTTARAQNRGRHSKPHGPQRPVLTLRSRYGYRLRDCVSTRTDRRLRAGEVAVKKPVPDSTEGAFGHSDASRSRCWYRRNTLSRVPLYLAHRSANICLLLVSYHHAPERFKRT